VLKTFSHILILVLDYHKRRLTGLGQLESRRFCHTRHATAATESTTQTALEIENASITDG